LVLVNNYAIRLYDEVERAKIALSSAYFATIQPIIYMVDFNNPT
jgi:hypothetical protein